MARRVKKDKEPEPGEGGSGVAAFRGNGFDPDIAKGFVDRIENLHGDLASEKGEFMARCKVIQADIKEVLTEAKNAGIPKKPLKSLVKQRKLERDIENIRTDLEGDDQDSFDQLVMALGKFAETELGAAAVQQAA
jgi:uncharacterized protein (UPF0335 family)